MKRLAVLAVLIFVFTIHAKPKPKVAVMDIKDSSGSFPEDILGNATEMLRGKLSATGTFIVIDRSRQKEKLQDIIKKEKKESYEQCYDSSCQIPLGQALAADRILRTSISCLGNSCMLSTEMVDLAKEAVTEGSTASFQKDLENLSSLIKSIEKVTSDLSFKVSGTPSTDGQALTTTKHREKITPEKMHSPETGLPTSSEVKGTSSQSETQLILETVPSKVKAVFSKGSSFEQTCSTPCTMNNIPSGTYPVTFKKKGFRTVTKRYQIFPGTQKYMVILDQTPSEKAFLAVENNDLDQLRSLGAQIINVTNDERRTILMEAARLDNTAAARHLLSMGADPYKKDPQGKTALDYTQHGSQIEMIIKDSMGDRKALTDNNWIMAYLMWPGFGFELGRIRWEFFQMNILDGNVGLKNGNVDSFSALILSLGFKIAVDSHNRHEFGGLISPLSFGMKWAEVSDPSNFETARLNTYSLILSKFYYRFILPPVHLEIGLNMPLIWWQYDERLDNLETSEMPISFYTTDQLVLYPYIGVAF